MSRCCYVCEHVAKTSINEAGDLSIDENRVTRADLFRAGEFKLALFGGGEGTSGWCVLQRFCVRARCMGKAGVDVVCWLSQAHQDCTSEVASFLCSGNML